MRVILQSALSATCLVVQATSGGPFTVVLGSPGGAARGEPGP